MAVKRDSRGRFAGSTRGFRGIFSGMEPGKQFRQLFHGARNQIDDTHVRPPSVTGAPAASSHGFSHGAGKTPHTELAFSTEMEHSAWQYAHPGNPYPEHPSNNDPDPKYRGRVYTVAPAHDQEGGSSETYSPTGFRITGEHHSAPGATSTFHEVNWNAYKARPTGHSSLVSSHDYNHSYMEVDPDPPAHVPPPYAEGKREHDNRYRAPDARHPDQLNLFTGKTVTEHKAYENTPGMMLDIGRGAQFDEVAFRRDPSVGTIRRSKTYHRVDEQLGTVH